MGIMTHVKEKEGDEDTCEGRGGGDEDTCEGGGGGK